MTVADERTTAPVAKTPPPVEPSRFSLKHPRSRIAWIRPAVWLPLVVMLVLLGGLWHWGAEQLPYLLPPLSDVGSSLSDELGYYVHNALVTLGEATAGLGMGFVGAFVLAVLTSELPLVRRAVMPIAVVLNVTPLVAVACGPCRGFRVRADAQADHHWADLFLSDSHQHGYGVAVCAAAGVAGVPDDGCESGRVAVARAHSSCPAVSLSCAADCLSAVDHRGGGGGDVGVRVYRGLGTAISVASSMNQLPVVYASILVLAVMGVLLLLAVTVVERRVLHWHDSTD